MSDDTTTDEVEDAPIDPTELTIAELESELVDGEYTQADIDAIRAAEGGDEDGRKGALEAIDELDSLVDELSDADDDPEPLESEDDVYVESKPEPEPESTGDEPASFVELLSGRYQVNCPNCGILVDVEPDTECDGCGAEIEYRVRAVGGD